jgi:hypothetical protein
MKNYRLIVDFHAENDEDAISQGRSVVIGDGVGFDDGFLRAEIRSRPTATAPGEQIDSFDEHSLDDEA